MADEYLQQLRRMMSEIEDRREYISDNEYLTEMNNCLQSYLTYHEEQCTCTEDTFECYRYPRLLLNCRHKDVILQYAPLLSILIPGGEIPVDFRLQVEVAYEPYDHDLLVRILRYLLDFSLESDSIFEKINSLENKIEKYREKTPEERLHLRSLDSYPFNQKLTDFFEDKKEDMEMSGKNEYVLTDDEVQNFSPNEIKKTFNKFTDQYPKNNNY